jgi:hypothetical protein
MGTRTRPDEGRCAWVAIPDAAGEGVWRVRDGESEARKREGVCVWMREECESATRELLGETRRRGDAVHNGPAWLQRHGCEFVTGVMLEARGGELADARGGKSDCISTPG